MSTIITSSDGKVYNTEGFIDNSSEITSISTTNYSPGDILVAINDGKVFVLNNDRIWTELGGAI